MKKKMVLSEVQESAVRETRTDFLPGHERVRIR